MLSSGVIYPQVFKGVASVVMSQLVRQRLEAAGLALPDGPVALGDYVPAVRSGSLVFTSGQLPIRAGALLGQGVVGRDVDSPLGAPVEVEIVLELA